MNNNIKEIIDSKEFYAAILKAVECAKSTTYALDWDTLEEREVDCIDEDNAAAAVIAVIKECLIGNNKFESQ